MAKHIVYLRLSIGYVGANKTDEMILEDVLDLTFEEIEAMDKDKLDQIVADLLDEWAWNYIDLCSNVEIEED